MLHILSVLVTTALTRYLEGGLIAPYNLAMCTDIRINIISTLG